MLVISGDAFGAGIVAHLSRDDLAAMDAQHNDTIKLKEGSTTRDHSESKVNEIAMETTEL